VEKLKRLIQVSESLDIEQIGAYLGIHGKELFDRLVDWALEFGLPSQPDSFVAE
jgi:hypothetical protein